MKKKNNFSSPFFFNIGYNWLRHALQQRKQFDLVFQKSRPFLTIDNFYTVKIFEFLRVPNDLPLILEMNSIK